MPVIDEDGDGELADEIPLDRDGNGSFLDDGPPRYADGKSRDRCVLARDARAPEEWRPDQRQRDHGPLSRFHAGETRRYRYWDLDPGLKPDRIAAAGIAVYNRGGWFDYHARDTTQWFGTLQGHTPDRLLMAPTGHAGLPSAEAQAQGRGNAYLAYFGDGKTSNALVLNEKLRFFDRYLRGLHNGFDAEPPVLIYVMGEGWRREDEWPLHRAGRCACRSGRTGTSAKRPV